MNDFEVMRFDDKEAIDYIVNDFIKDKKTRVFKKVELQAINNVLNDFFNNKHVDWKRDVVFEIDYTKGLKTIDNYFYGKTLSLFKYDNDFVFQIIHDNSEALLIITDDLEQIVSNLDINFYRDLECIKLQKRLMKDE